MIDHTAAAEAYYLHQAERLLTEAGFYEHSDGQWYDHPEPPEDTWPDQ